jgi:hypothetical protein
MCLLLEWGLLTLVCYGVGIKTLFSLKSHLYFLSSKLPVLILCFFKIFIYLFILVVLGFELRALPLLGRHSIT